MVRILTATLGTEYTGIVVEAVIYDQSLTQVGDPIAATPDPDEVLASGTYGFVLPVADDFTGYVSVREVGGGVLVSGTITPQLVDEDFVMLVNRMAVPMIGNVTGARTGTEVFIYNGVTLTATVDGNGNRTVIFT